MWLFSFFSTACARLYTPPPAPPFASTSSAASYFSPASMLWQPQEAFGRGPIPVIIAAIFPTTEHNIHRTLWTVKKWLNSIATKKHGCNIKTLLLVLQLFGFFFMYFSYSTFTLIYYCIQVTLERQEPTVMLFWKNQDDIRFSLLIPWCKKNYSQPFSHWSHLIKQ